MSERTEVIKLKPKSKTGFFVLFGLSTAFLLATPVLIFLLIGLALDHVFKTTPIITLIAVTIGAVGGLYNVMKLVKTFRNNTTYPKNQENQSKIEN